MSWFKKTLGMTVLLGGTAAFGCSGTNQLVGSDGGSHAGGNNGGGNLNGGGSKTSGSASTPEPIYELWQLNTTIPDDDRPYLCMPVALPTNADGNADGYVLSVRQSTDCNCAAAGLSPASAEQTRTARAQTKLVDWCDTAGGIGACADLCVCEVDPAVGTSLQQCQTEAEPDASTTGWCYVTADGGAAQSALVEACAPAQKHRLRFFGPITDQREQPSVTTELLFLGAPFPRVAAALGDPCITEMEYDRGFRGYSVKEVNIEDHSPACESGICVVNHFQGRASCPYGQAEAGGDCLAAGSYDSVMGPVAPQLYARQAKDASICSCQCAGPGPGPYCTCPEQMQCEHLVDDLQLGNSALSGSYCIPKNTQYDPQGSTELCEEGGCGASHRFN